MNFTVSQFIPEVYHPAWRSMRNFSHDEYWFKGGRGTAKSTTAANRGVTLIVRDPTANFVCFKKHKVEIEDTVYAEIGKVITRLNWGDLFRFKTSPFEITYRPTKQKIFFRGLDDSGKSKGITAKVGYVQGAWFEETDQFAGMKEIDTVLQALGRGGPHFHVIFTYNPPESPANWVNVEVGKVNPRRFVLHTTYKDIPADWLGPFFFHKMEAIRADSEMRYRHEYLGEVTGTGNEIFRNVKQVHFSKEDIAEMRRKRWAMDFGQGDPTTIVGTNYIPRMVDGVDIGGRLQIFNEWYKVDARNREIFAAIKERGLEYETIEADSGGGGLSVINEMRDLGIRGIRQAYKPGGSVERGIRWMRGLQAIEIGDDCPNAYREFSTYIYDTMRDGTNRNEFPDRDNHTIDPARYSRVDEIFGGSGSRLLI